MSDPLPDLRALGDYELWRPAQPPNVPAEHEHAPVPVPNGKRVTLGMYVAEYTVRNGWSWWEDTPTHYEHSTGWGILHTALDRIHALEAEVARLQGENTRLREEIHAEDIARTVRSKREDRLDWGR